MALIMGVAPFSNAPVGALVGVWPRQPYESDLRTSTVTDAPCSFVKDRESVHKKVSGDSQYETTSTNLETDRAKAFHHQMVFIRFRPLAASGQVGGANPIPDVMGRAQP
jgi:hypothetical protein